MIHLIRIVGAVVLVLFGSYTRAEPEQEVELWYRSYAAHWFGAEVDIDAVAKFYASPFYYLSAKGPLLDTGDTMKGSLESYAQTWKNDGWAGAKLLDIEVRMLNESSAMILTEWDIYRADGSSVIDCPRAPWTYLAAKTEAGWKLTLEIEIDCNQKIVLGSN